MKEINNKDLRNFGIILTVIILVIGVRVSLKLAQIHFVYVVAAVVSAVCSFFYPICLRPIYNILIKIAHTVGWINTRLLLILVFYLVTMPIGLFARIVRRDLLGLEIEKKKVSYWVKRVQETFNLTQYEKQF